MFLATNSHEEYMEVIMSHTLGPDWKSLFDLSCANCQKPRFFRSEQSFFEIDKSTLNFKGRAIDSEVGAVEPGSVLLEGSASLLEKYF